jgi:hypothetical protein
MKRENLYIVSAALLASTALSTIANAGVVTLATLSATDSTSTTTAKRVSAQIFASTPTTATTIGGGTGVALIYRFNSPLSLNQSSFSSTIGVTGAQFQTSSVSGGTSIRGFTANSLSTTGSITLTGDQASVTCTGLVATTTSLIISNCTVTAFTGTGSVAGFVVSAVAFDNATGLATVGGSISIAGTVNLGVSAGSGAVFDTTASQVVVTSANSMSATSTVGTPAQINVSGTPAFSRLVGGFLTATIATVNITRTGTLAGDLSSSITAGLAVGGANFIRLSSPILTDDAVANVTLEAVTTPANSLSNTPTQFASGAVTFTIAAANINDSFRVVVNFSGSAAIEAATAGTVDVSFAAITGAATATANSSAPTGLTGGAVAALSRSGLSVNVNGIQPNIAQGLTYVSLLRIVNSSGSAGVATVTLRNNDTGVVLGTYTSPSIPGGGALQVTAGTLESGAGITPSASVLYQATVSGAFNGYVQHVNFNQAAGSFTDLSAKRVD